MDILSKHCAFGRLDKHCLDKMIKMGKKQQDIHVKRCPLPKDNGPLYLKGLVLLATLNWSPTVALCVVFEEA